MARIRSRSLAPWSCSQRSKASAEATGTAWETSIGLMAPATLLDPGTEGRSRWGGPHRDRPCPLPGLLVAREGARGRSRALHARRGAPAPAGAEQHAGRPQPEQGAGRQEHRQGRAAGERQDPAAGRDAATGRGGGGSADGDRGGGLPGGRGAAGGRGGPRGAGGGRARGRGGGAGGGRGGTGPTAGDPE